MLRTHRRDTEGGGLVEGLRGIVQVKAQPVPEFVLRGHRHEVQALCFFSLSRHVFTSPSKDETHGYKSHTSKFYHSRSKPPIEDPQSTLECLVSGDNSGLVIVWNLETNRPLVLFQPHKDVIVHVDVPPLTFGRVLLTQGKEGTVKLWDLCRLLSLSGEAAFLQDFNDRLARREGLLITQSDGTMLQLLAPVPAEVPDALALQWALRGTSAPPALPYTDPHAVTHVPYESPDDLGLLTEDTGTGGELDAGALVEDDWAADALGVAADALGVSGENLRDVGYRDVDVYGTYGGYGAAAAGADRACVFDPYATSDAAQALARDVSPAASAAGLDVEQASAGPPPVEHAMYLYTAAPLPPTLSFDSALPARLAVLRTNAYAFCRAQTLPFSVHLDTRAEQPQLAVRLLLVAPSENASAVKLWLLRLTFAAMDPATHHSLRPHAPPAPALVRLPRSTRVLADVCVGRPALTATLLFTQHFDPPVAPQRVYGMVVAARLIDLHSHVSGVVAGARDDLQQQLADAATAAASRMPALHAAVRRRVACAEASVRAHGMRGVRAGVSTDLGAAVDRVCEVHVRGESGLASQLRARQQREREATLRRALEEAGAADVDDVDDVDTTVSDAVTRPLGSEADAMVGLNNELDSDELEAEEDGDGTEGEDDAYLARAAGIARGRSAAEEASPYVADAAPAAVVDAAPRRVQGFAVTSDASTAAAAGVPEEPWHECEALPCVVLVVGTESGHVVVGQAHVELDEEEEEREAEVVEDVSEGTECTAEQVGEAVAASLVLGCAGALGGRSAAAQGEAAGTWVPVGSVAAERAGMRAAQRYVLHAQLAEGATVGDELLHALEDGDDANSALAAPLDPSAEKGLSPLARGDEPACPRSQLRLRGALAWLLADAEREQAEHEDPVRELQRAARTPPTEDQQRLAATTALAKALAARLRAKRDGFPALVLREQAPLRRVGRASGSFACLWQRKLLRDAVVALDVRARGGHDWLGLRVAVGTAARGLVSVLLGVQPELDTPAVVASAGGPRLVSLDGALSLRGGTLLAYTATHESARHAAAHTGGLHSAAVTAAARVVDALSRAAQLQRDGHTDADSTVQALSSTASVLAPLGAAVPTGVVRVGAYTVPARVLAAGIAAYTLGRTQPREDEHADAVLAASAAAADAWRVCVVPLHVLGKAGTGAVTFVREGSRVAVGGWDGRARVLAADAGVDEWVGRAWTWLQAVAQVGAAAGVDMYGVDADDSNGLSDPLVGSARPLGADSDAEEEDEEVAAARGEAVPTAEDAADTYLSALRRALVLMPALEEDELRAVARHMRLPPTAHTTAGTGATPAQQLRGVVSGVLRAQEKRYLAKQPPATNTRDASLARELGALMGGIEGDEAGKEAVVRAVREGRMGELRDPEALRRVMAEGADTTVAGAQGRSAWAGVGNEGDCLLDYLQGDALGQAVAALALAQGETRAEVQQAAEAAGAKALEALAQRDPLEVTGTRLWRRFGLGPSEVALSAEAAMETLYWALRASDLASLSEDAQSGARGAMAYRLFGLLSLLQHAQDKHRAKQSHMAGTAADVPEGLDLQLTNLASDGFGRAEACEAILLLQGLGVPALQDARACAVIDRVVRGKRAPTETRTDAQSSSRNEIPLIEELPSSDELTQRLLTRTLTGIDCVVTSHTDIPSHSHTQVALLKGARATGICVVERTSPLQQLAHPEHYRFASSGPDGSIVLWPSIE